MRVLVTGGHGFIGRWLARDLGARGHEVVVTHEPAGPGGAEPVEGAARSLACDVRDAEAVLAALRDARPERIYHLAAQSYPALSWAKAAETMATNVLGTVHLLEANRALGLGARVLLACSSAEYGHVEPHEVPVREDHALRPLHPYGVSKVATDLLGFQEHRSHGTHVVRVRIFNTTGPGKVGDVCSDFARRAVEVELGLRGPVLPVGNLEARRAFCDVRDMVRALELALEKGRAGEVYNAGAAEAVAVRHVLDLVLSLTDAKPRVEVDKALLRPIDEPIILGDTARLREATGWEPRIPLRATLQDIVEYWRRALAGRP